MNYIKKLYCAITITLLFSLSAKGAKPVITQEDYARTYQQLETALPIIVEVLQDLHTHEDYWKVQQLTPLSYFLSKDPTKWIFRNQEWLKMDLSLAFLKKEKEHNATYLSLFKRFLTEKEELFTSESKFIEVLETLEEFLTYYPHNSTLYSNSNKPKVETIKQRVARNEYLLRHYKRNADKAFAHCSEPNHFQRNWLGYSIGAIVIGACSYFVYKNRSKLETWVDTGLQGVKKYYHEHISNPIVKALASIFDKNRDSLVEKEGVSARKNDMERTIRNHYERYNKDIPVEAIDAIVNDALKGNFDEILKRENDLEKKFAGFSNFFIHIFSIQELIFEYLSCKNITMVKNVLLQKDIGARDLENLKNAQAFNIELLAVLPTALLGYFTYLVGKKLFTNIVLQKNTYQPLRKALRQLHIIFNTYVASNSQLSLSDQGLVYYWIEQFKKYSHHLALNERKMILDDLKELESGSFNITQKLNVITRMYCNYHFLLPNKC